MAEIPPVALKFRVDTGALAEVLPLLRELQQLVSDFGKQRVVSGLAKDVAQAAQVTREQVTRLQQIQQMLERSQQRRLDKQMLAGFEALQKIPQQQLSLAQATQVLAAAEEQATKSGMQFSDALAAQLRAAGVAETHIAAVTKALSGMKSQTEDAVDATERLAQIQQMLARTRQREMDRDIVLGAQALGQLSGQQLATAQAAQILAAAEQQAAQSGMAFAEALAAQLRMAGMAENQIRVVTQAFAELHKQATTNISTFNSGKLGGYISVIGGYAGLVPGMPAQVFAPIQRIGFIQALGRSSELAVSTIMKVGVMVGAIGGAFAFLYKSMSRYIDLEEKLIRIRLASGSRMTEGGILGQITRIASGMGLRYGIDQITDAVLALTRSGIKLEEAFGGAAQAVLRFARVAEIDVKQAVMDLVSLSAQLSLPFERVADIIAKVADMTSSSMDYIADAFSTAASSAESLGLSAEQLGAFITILDKAAIRGPEAGTALRAFFSSLSAIQGGTMTQTQRETLVRLNMSTQVFLLQRGLISVMDFVKALLKSGASAADLMTLFERRGERAASAVRKFLGEFGDLTKAIEDSKGQMQKMASALENSMKAIAETIAQKIDEALVSFGEKIVQFFKGTLFKLLAPTESNMAEGLQALYDVLEKAKAAGISPENISHKELGQSLYAWLRRAGSALPPGKLTEAFQSIIEFAKSSGIPEETLYRMFDEVMRPIHEELKQFPRSMSPGNRPWRDIAAEVWKVQNELYKEIYKKAQEETKKTLSSTQSTAATSDLVNKTYKDLVRGIISKIGDDIKQAVDTVTISEEVLGVGDLLSRLFKDITQRMAKRIRDDSLEYFTQTKEGKKFVQGIVDSIFGSISGGKLKIFTPGNEFLSGILKAIGIDSGAASDLLPKILADVLAGVFVDLGNILVSVIVSGLRAFIQALRGPQRGRSASWGQVQYMRTGQGIAPARMYSPTFAPAVNIGTINVNSSALGREHDAIASVLYSQIQRAALFAVESATTTMAYAFEGVEDF